MQVGFKHSTKRHERDYYQTPQWCIELIPKVFSPEDDILDAGAGDGRIGNYLLKSTCGLNSIDINPPEGSLVEKQDFFEVDYKSNWIVMNPPYSLGKQFVEHALTLCTKGIVALLPFSFLNPKNKSSLRKYCQSIHVLGRVKFTNQSPAWDSAWFIFMLLNTLPTEIQWLEKGKRYE